MKVLCIIQASQGNDRGVKDRDVGPRVSGGRAHHGGGELLYQRRALFAPLPFQRRVVSLHTTVLVDEDGLVSEAGAAAQQIDNRKSRAI